MNNIILINTILITIISLFYNVKFADIKDIDNLIEKSIRISKSNKITMNFINQFL